jgi:hypothetical protein
MRRRALLLCVALMAAAAPAARADVVATVPTSTYITDLSIGPTGAVWAAAAGPTRDRSQVGLLAPGAVRWTGFPIVGQPLGGTSENRVFARPDGGAWGWLGGRFALRSTPASFASTAIVGKGGYVGSAAMASDGALVIGDGETTLTRVAPDGTRSTIDVKLPVPKGQSFCDVSGVTAAPGGVLYVDDGCDRLLRVAPGAAPKPIAIPESLEVGTTPDVLTGADGTLWLSDDDSLARSTASGFAKVALPANEDGSFMYMGPWTAAPDGSVWIANSSGCGLLHVTTAGVQVVPAPLHVLQLVAAPDGTLWMANRWRIEHVAPSALTAPKGGCDETEPTVTLPDRRKGATVSLRALQRHGGLRIRSSEPATLIGVLTAVGREVRPQQAIGRTPSVIRFGSSLLRRLAERVAKGERTTLKLTFLQAWDAEQNGGGPDDDVLRVVR